MKKIKYKIKKSGFGRFIMSNFYSMLFRMKYIDRWALMRNLRKENLSEHTLEVAFIAHALCIIEKTKLKNANINTEKIVLAALFHDTSEVITGDLPTPVKYFNSDIKTSYKNIEAVAEEKLLSLLPDYFTDEIKDVYNLTEEEEKTVKLADKISALIKCTEEVSFGNYEFKEAKKSTEKSIKEFNSPAADIFIKEFLPAFSLSLDEQTKL